MLKLRAYTLRPPPIFAHLYLPPALIPLPKMSRSTRSHRDPQRILPVLVASVKKRKRDPTPAKAEDTEENAKVEEQHKDEAEEEIQPGASVLAQFKEVYPQSTIVTEELESLLTEGTANKASECERAILALPKSAERLFLAKLYQTELALIKQKPFVQEETLPEKPEIITSQEKDVESWPAYHALTQSTTHGGTLFTFPTLEPAVSADLPKPPLGAEWVRIETSYPETSTRTLSDLSAHLPSRKRMAPKKQSIRPVEFLNYGPFSSFACGYDSGAAQVGYDDSVTLWEMLRKRRAAGGALAQLDEIKLQLNYIPPPPAVPQVFGDSEKDADEVNQLIAGIHDFESQLQTNEILLASLHNTPDATTAESIMKRLAWFTEAVGLTSVSDGRTVMDLTAAKSSQPDTAGLLSESSIVMTDLQVWKDI